MSGFLASDPVGAYAGAIGETGGDEFGVEVCYVCGFFGAVCEVIE